MGNQNSSQQEVQNIANNPESQTSNQNSSNPPQSLSLSRPIKSKKAIIILAVLLLILVTGGGSYYLNVQKKTDLKKPLNNLQASPTLYPQTSLTQSQPTETTASIETEIISVDEKTDKYVHHALGFAIPYSKYSLGRSNCSDFKNGNFKGLIPLEVFEDKAAGKIYIAESLFLEAKQAVAPDGMITVDYSTCTVIPTTLGIITNNPQKKLYDNNTLIPSGPASLMFTYKRVENDNDLQSLAQSVHPNCFIGSKNPIKNNPEVYTVELVNKTGKSIGNTPESGCFLNFSYLFQYSPKNRVAVITSGLQEALSWANGQKEPMIEFTTN